MTVAFNAVMPMFLTIIVGCMIGRTNMLDENSQKRINALLFNVLFPIVVICNLYGTSIKEAFDVKLIVYSITIGSILWLATIPVVMKIEKNDRSRGAMIQAINRSNFLVIGLPVVADICQGQNMAATAITIVGVILVNNIMSVIVLEVFRGRKPDGKKIAKGIIINPIVVSTVLGMLLMIFNVRMPQVAGKTLESLGGIATPLALLVIGASINLKSIKGKKKDVIICVIGKLFVVPGIVTGLGIILGFRGVEFVTLLAFFSASPTTTSYTMADQMDSDSELACASLVFSTALVAPAMFCWLLFYKMLGMY